MLQYVLNNYKLYVCTEKLLTTNSTTIWSRTVQIWGNAWKPPPKNSGTQTKDGSHLVFIEEFYGGKGIWMITGRINNEAVSLVFLRHSGLHAVCELMTNCSLASLCKSWIEITQQMPSETNFEEALKSASDFYYRTWMKTWLLKHRHLWFSIALPQFLWIKVTTLNERSLFVCWVEVPAGWTWMMAIPAAGCKQLWMNATIFYYHKLYSKYIF